jgi:Arc/MetJ-type ribon-helix-helix transcriptional regulator
VAQLVRKEITLTAEDAVALERFARGLGVSESTVVRKALRAMLDDRAAMQRAGALRGLFALAEQYATVVKAADDSEPRQLTRDELYDRIYRPVAG